MHQIKYFLTQLKFGYNHSQTPPPIQMVVTNDFVKQSLYAKSYDGPI